MTKTATQQVADNVRAEAARRRVSQAALARHLHLSQQSLSRRFLGYIAFDVNELAAIAEVLEVPIEALYGTATSAA